MISVLVIVLAFCMGAAPGARLCFLRLLHAEDQLRARRVELHVAARNASRNVRAAGRWALSQKARICELDAELGLAEDRRRSLEQEVRALSRVEERPRWILEGTVRGMAGRYGFRIQATDPARAFGRDHLPDWYRASWQRGRLVMVAGHSRQDAYRRVTTRWPASRGFSISDPDAGPTA